MLNADQVVAKIESLRSRRGSVDMLLRMITGAAAGWTDQPGRKRWGYREEVVKTPLDPGNPQSRCLVLVAGKMRGLFFRHQDFMIHLDDKWLAWYSDDVADDDLEVVYQRLPAFMADIAKIMPGIELDRLLR